MPLLDISSGEAMANLRNRATRWPDGRSGSDRFAGVAKTAIKPSFQFSRADRFFTMGSCFARNIETNLLKLGFDVPLSRFYLGEENTKVTSGIMNKYTVHSMANELRWAIETPGVHSNRQGVPTPLDKLFVQVDDATWHDPHFHMYAAPFENVRIRREGVEALMRELTGCSVFIFTLGLAESWYDRETALYLNDIPPTPALRLAPDRFRLHVISHDEILQELDYIYSLLEAHAPQDFRMLITVSPVPFKATFTGTDAIVANSYSKSVQRAAVEAFVSRHGNVDYFPSYEAVTCSDRSVAYELDRIHVSPGVVAEIMDRVVDSYSSGETRDREAERVVEKRTLRPEEQSVLAIAWFKEGEYWKAAVAFSGIIDLFGETLGADKLNDARIYLIWSLIRSDQGDIARKKLDALRTEELSAKLSLQAGMQHRALKSVDKAIELIRRSVVLGGDAARADHELAACYKVAADLDNGRKPSEQAERLAAV